MLARGLLARVAQVAATRGPVVRALCCPRASTLSSAAAASVAASRSGAALGLCTVTGAGVHARSALALGGRWAAQGSALRLLCSSVRCYASGAAAPKERQAAARQPRRRARADDDEEAEEEEDEEDEMVFTSDEVIDPQANKWTWVGEFPKEDFSEKTDRVEAGKNWELEPIDQAAFQNYFIPSRFQYVDGAPIVYTHREYIGTGVLRGKPVPGVQKVALRVKLADLKLTPAADRYIRALAGLRISTKNELKLSCNLYPLVEDNIRFLYDQVSRLVEEARKADAIDAAIAAGRDPDTDPAVRSLDAENKKRAGERAADTARVMQAREEEAQRQRERIRAAKQAALRERLMREKEEEERAKLAAEAAVEAGTASAAGAAPSSS